MTPRVVRFGDEPAPEPDRAAPVARFGEGVPDPSPPKAGPAGMFEDLDAPTAAPVASVGDLSRRRRDPGDRDPGDPGAVDDAGIRDTPTPAGISVADIAGFDGAPAPVSRTAELAGLVPGGRGRRSATPNPGGRSLQREAASRTVADDVAKQARRDRRSTADRGAAAARTDDEEPAATNRPRQRDRSAGGKARPGGGGFGGRGAPAALDPDADPVAVAKDVCLRLLTDRARTRQELAQALRRKGVPDDAARTVLERFDEVGLIDDTAFAGQWVRSRHNHRGLARRAIAMELRRKGVDDEVASEALGEVDQESEERRARELVDRKLRTVPADTPEQRTKAATRLVGMLARKGYGVGIAYRVVREALTAHGAEIDELGTDPPD